MTNDKTSSALILLAAGGTGGHVFPAIATAKELESRGNRVWFATDKRGEKYLQGKGFKYTIITSASPNPKKPQTLVKLGVGVLQSIRLMFKVRPVAVIGFGGYPSFPPLITSRVFRLRTILHEQNSVLGKANRLLAKFAHVVAASFPETKHLKKGVVVGNPVRPEIQPSELPSFDGKIKILVTGGSQGARIFSHILPDALCRFADKISVVHQATEREVEEVTRKYKECGIEAEVKTFFDDMPKRLTECHLLIARSGASTIFELATAGRPAIFVPLPSSAENHQFINAQSVADINGSWIIPESALTADSVSNLLQTLLNDPAQIQTAAANIQKFAGKNSAALLADLVK